MGLSPGMRVGAYEILTPLGAGGMGEVYRARDSRLDRDVALKILPDAFSADQERLARFEREAKTLAALNHPNIAHVYGFEQESGTQALVMELVEGEDLAQRLARGAMPLDEALPLARQLVEALDTAHEQGIIHRDLKPANIKVRPDGTAKVLDFGLAKALETAGSVASRDSRHPAAALNSPTITSPAMTARGMILGTAAYMSPEQAKGLAADKRSDIWAFGCVLFEMLSGKRTFAGDDVSETLATVLKDPPEWTALPAATPPAIRQLLRRCLEKDRRKRLADIADARFAFDEPESLPEPGAATAARSRPSFWRRALALVTTAVLAAGLTSLVWWRARPAFVAAPVVRMILPLAPGTGLPGGTTQQVFDISRAGDQIVYSTGMGLQLRRLSEMSSRPIPGTEAENKNLVHHPVFSPDGQSVAFFMGLRLATLKKVDLATGTPVTLAETRDPSGLVWENDHLLFIVRGGLMRVPAGGGAVETLIREDANEVMQGPQLLPDGDTVLYSVARTEGARSGPLGNTVIDLETWDRARIVAHSMKSGQRKVLIEGGSDVRYLRSGHLTFARSGVLFAAPFDATRVEVTGTAVSVIQGVTRSIGPPSSGGVHARVSDTGTLVFVQGPAVASSRENELGIFDRAGRREPLKLPSAMYEAPRLSPDGKQLAYATLEGDRGLIWIYEMSGDRAPRQLTLTGSGRFPIWSPDGTRVIFQFSGGAAHGLFIQRADGSTPPERLTTAEPDTLHLPEAWSTDGRTVLFAATDKEGRSDLWSLPLPGGKPALLATLRSMLVPAAAFSPDGKWVAYALREGPAQETPALYVQPFPATGAKYLITPNGFRPQWSPDGKEVFFGRRGESWVVSVSTSPTFSFANPSELPIRRVPPPGPAEREFDYLPDGKRFVFATPASRAAPSDLSQLQLVLNWFEELKQRVPAQ